MSSEQENTIQNQNIVNYCEKLLPPSKNKYYICCFSEKWCFDHRGISLNKEYDENVCLCFQFLDCCAWCLEFKQKRNCFCRDTTVCFMCCCTITFD
jgi:hypothetical protein